MEDELHSTSMDLSEKNRQLLSIREEQTAQKSSIGCLQDKITEAESEVRLFMGLSFKFKSYKQLFVLCGLSERQSKTPWFTLV